MESVYLLSSVFFLAYLYPSYDMVSTLVYIVLNESIALYIICIISSFYMSNFS